MPKRKEPSITPKRDKRANTQQPNNNGNNNGNAVQNLAGAFQEEANNAGLTGGSVKLKKLKCACSSLKGGKKIKRKTNKRKTEKARKIKEKKSKKTIKKRTLKAKKGVKHAKGGFSFANTPFTTFDYSSRFNDNQRLKIYPEYFLRDIYDIHKNIITPQQRMRGTYNKVPVSFDATNNDIHNINHTFNEIMKTLDSTNGNVNYPNIKKGRLGQNKIKCIVDVALNKKDNSHIGQCKKILN
tara:strand:- start:1652 stop:2371 length:720 start_codon:yes stop_codon:yes gene_type:complete